MAEQQYETVKLDLLEALEYMEKHNLVADGPVVWMNGEAHLATKSAPALVLPTEAEVGEEINQDISTNDEVMK